MSSNYLPSSLNDDDRHEKRPVLDETTTSTKRSRTSTLTDRDDDDDDDGQKSEALDVSPVDLAAAVDVLQRVGKWSEKNRERYRDDPNLRPLRKALAPLAALQCRGMFDGAGSLSEYRKQQNRRKEENRRKSQETHEQRKYLDTSLLRRSRIDRLNALRDDAKDEEEERHLRFLIPDGPANVATTTTTTTTRLSLTNGSDGQTATTTMTTKDDVVATDEPPVVILPKLRSCYVCKRRFRELHRFYDQLCPRCAALNWEKRHATVDLTGCVAVLTGARVKIGLQVGLKLLRAGCVVVATTRFPNAACETYRRQSDFASFRDRLHIYGLDLRDVVAVEAFCDFVKRRHQRVDVLVNNACQTVRRPAGYYAPLVENEARLFKEAEREGLTGLLAGCAAFENERRRTGGVSATLPLENGTTTTTTTTKTITNGTDNNKDQKASAIDSNFAASTDVVLTNSNGKERTFEFDGVSLSARSSLTALLPEDVGVDTNILPAGGTLVDTNGNPLDHRTQNSWLLRLPQVSTPELVETMFVNAVAPFVLHARLQSLMESNESDDAPRDRFVVHVSAMEGKFYRHKTPHHPHTNMAKAALNMLTRTVAEDAAKHHRVYTNSVDTGWINDENPAAVAAGIAARNHFQTPIDETDAAARILDPIFEGVRRRREDSTQEPAYGKFFKDYVSTEW